MRRFLVGITVSIISVLFGVAVGFAFDNSNTCPGCAWNNFFVSNGYNMVKVKNGGLGSYSTDPAEKAFQNAANDWNANTAVLRFLWSSDTASPMTRRKYIDANTTVGGYAQRTTSGTVITKCDAYLNMGLTLGEYARQTVAAHELGHCYGLGHSNDPQAVMQTEQTATAMAALNVSADDMLGIQAHYSFE